MEAAAWLPGRPCVAAGQKAPPGASPITGPQLTHTVLPAAAYAQGTHRKQTGWAGQGQATPPTGQHLGQRP